MNAIYTDVVKQGHHGLNQLSSTVHTESRIFGKLCCQTIYMKLREIIEKVFKSTSLSYVHILSQLVKYTDTHA